MPSKTISVTNGDGSTKTITIPDRSRFAGVRTIDRQAPPLSDSTVRLQITVSGHADMSGVYERTSTSSNQYKQVGGYGYLEINAIADGAVEWGLVDGSDNNPNTVVSVNGMTNTLPWQGLSEFAASGITLTPVQDTLTVNRTAPVITSDRKGASRPLLSKLVGGAAAAYSLRDLNDRNGNNKVVRVRRASDNNERDFLAKEVSNGTLKNWVNTQTVLPLDLQALVDSDSDGNTDGRTGSVIGASAAYSLRNLSKNYTGNVVDVRRSSDDAVQGFTAAQVADGTLLAFVNEDLGVTLGNATAINSCTITDASSTGFTYTTSGTSLAGARVPLSQTIPAGATINITLTTTKSFGMSPTLRLARGSTFSNAGDPINIASSTNGTQTFSVKSILPATSFVFYDNVAGNFTISDFKINSIVYDGHVSKWYDQSGNTKHATQGAPSSQPKIVENGNLLTDGITFDNADDELSVSDDPVITASSSGAFSGFSVQTVATTEGGYLYGNASPSRGSSAYANLGEFTIINKTTPKDKIPRSSGQNLLSFVYNNGDAGLLVNGAGTMTDVDTYGFAASTSDFVIGNRNGGAHHATFLSGSIKEIIIYNDDQSANRTAIEANIGEAYRITGIPAYDNTVDGFVEAWYDQSGNVPAKDATQPTSGSQPKIVENGNLINGGIAFDGTDDKLSFDSSVALSTNEFFVTSVVKVLDGDGEDIVIVSRPAGNGFLMNLDYDNNQAQMRTDSGSFKTQSFTVNEPTGNILVTVQRVSDTVTLFHQGSSASTFSVTGSSFTLGSFGQRTPSSFSKHLISEIIMYNSDQSANRPAIEANINNQYDIY